ncbi:MAG: hypothetical protein MJ230_04360 [bacterium]|nr:hypothetical protein [bacterium]
MEESEIAQYVSDTSKLFANQVLAEANKRGCSIDGVLKASDIKFENGKIRLQAGKETIAETPIVQMDVNAEIVTDDTVKMDENGQTKLFQDETGLTNDYYNNPTENKTLPNLDSKDLALIGKKSKPVILKKNIIEKNKTHHKEILVDENNEIIFNGLYNAEIILQTNPQNKENYFDFIAKRNGKNDNVVIELAENKDNFEIVGWYIISDKGLKTKIRTTNKNGGQSIITERSNLKGQQSNSALLVNGSNNIITDNTENLNPDELNQLTNLPKQKKVNRGSYNVSEKAIELFKTADFSTLPHEFAHFWLDNMWEFSRSGRASKAYMNNFNSVLDWLGVKEGQTYLTRQQQEKFARGYEKPQKCTK